MAERAEPTSTARLFERITMPWWWEAFGRGQFDYLEGAGEVSETDFFRAMTGPKVLQELADTYPSPHKKHDVPLWVYIASDISMRFHGVVSLAVSGELCFQPWGPPALHPKPMALHRPERIRKREQARKKILAKTGRLRRNLAHQLDHARPP